MVKVQKALKQVKVWREWSRVCCGDLINLDWLCDVS